MKLKAIPVLLSTILSISTVSGASAETPKTPPGEAVDNGFLIKESKPGNFESQDIENVVLKDPSRNKDLPLRVVYPREGGPYPVIIFSHGLGGSKDSYAPLIGFWVSHGYAVLAPTHADSLKLRRANGEKITDFMRPGEIENGWYDRVLDLRLVLDQLPKLIEQYPELKTKLDRNKVGVGGHSFGALTTEILTGARVDNPHAGDRKLDPATTHDGRPKAALLLSPSGISEQPKLTMDSWNGVHTPTMVMTGTQDRGRLGQDPSWRTEPYLYSPAGSKYLIVINNGTHMIFSGDQSDAKKLSKLFGSSPLANGLFGREVPQKEYDEMFNEVKLASVLFWDSYLKGDKESRKAIDSNALKDFSADVATVSRR